MDEIELHNLGVQVDEARQKVLEARDIFAKAVDDLEVVNKRYAQAVIETEAEKRMKEIKAL